MRYYVSSVQTFGYLGRPRDGRVPPVRVKVDKDRPTPQSPLGLSVPLTWVPLYPLFLESTTPYLLSD